MTTSDKTLGEALFKAIVAHGKEGLTDWEIGFIRDMHNDLEKWKDKYNWSEKRIATLEKIVEDREVAFIEPAHEEDPFA